MKRLWYRARPARRPERDALDAACRACGARTAIRIGTSAQEFDVLRERGCDECGHASSERLD